MVVRILLIVPDVQPRLDTTPEIRTLTSLHQVTVLSGTLSNREIYAAAQSGNYQVIHIGAHANTFRREDVLQVARVANAELVLLNACHTGAIASFLVSHKIRYVIATNIELENGEAWKMPLAFYEYLARQEKLGSAYSIPDAYVKADTGDGDYIITLDLSSKQANGVNGQDMRHALIGFFIFNAISTIVLSYFVWLLS